MKRLQFSKSGMPENGPGPRGSLSGRVSNQCRSPGQAWSHYRSMTNSVQTAARLVKDYFAFISLFFLCFDFLSGFSIQQRWPADDAPCTNVFSKSPFRFGTSELTQTLENAAPSPCRRRPACSAASHPHHNILCEQNSKSGPQAIRARSVRHLVPEVNAIG